MIRYQKLQFSNIYSFKNVSPNVLEFDLIYKCCTCLTFLNSTLCTLSSGKRKNWIKLHLGRMLFTIAITFLHFFPSQNIRRHKMKTTTWKRRKQQQKKKKKKKMHENRFQIFWHVLRFATYRSILLRWKWFFHLPIG